MAKQSTTNVGNSHLGLLCDIGELNALFAGSDDIEAFLQQIVMLVAKHIDAAVCSIYMFDDLSRELVLKATLGLHKRSVNKTRLKIGEGLVGLAMKEQRPICERIASQNPHYKLFPGINEEAFESFLAIPIQRGLENIGALVVQREEENSFGENDIMALKAITSQLAGAIENSRILMALHAKKKEKNQLEIAEDLKFIHAEVASEGIALANISIIDEGKPYQNLKKQTYAKTYSLKEFKNAVSKTEIQLEELQEQVENKLSGVASLIFEAHILMLKDKEFTGSMVKRINNGSNPPDAILAVANKYIRMFSEGSNVYMQEKSKDVEDLARRLFDNLVGKEGQAVTNWKGRIVIAEDLFPSDILRLSSDEVSGIILISGGVTSHISILARSLQIPLVIADKIQLKKIPDDTLILLDAELGAIYINPDKKLISTYNERKRVLSSLSQSKPRIKPASYSKDGKQIHLLANINLHLDIKLANDFKSEGVGLYRTEFSFMVRSNFPTEEEQTVIYSSIIDQMPKKSINIRTLDIGGEKVLAYYDNLKENNPNLGMRSIRFSLSHKDLFQQQLRAILRGGKNALDLRITFPMISSVDEFKEAKKQILESLKSLKSENIPHFSSPKIGIMIETPSVIEIIDELAREADFFCIGTNDFIQYMLAVDRNNAIVSSYYTPHHPSVLRSLKKIAKAALKHKIDLSICGEMAHEEKYIPFLLGIGIRTLSIDPRYMPKVQEKISQLDCDECIKRADLMLKKDTIEKVAACL